MSIVRLPPTKIVRVDVLPLFNECKRRGQVDSIYVNPVAPALKALIYNKILDLDYNDYKYVKAFPYPAGNVIKVYVFYGSYMTELDVSDEYRDCIVVSQGNHVSVYDTADFRTFDDILSFVDLHGKVLFSRYEPYLYSFYVDGETLSKSIHNYEYVYTHMVWHKSLTADELLRGALHADIENAELCSDLAAMMIERVSNKCLSGE